MPPRCSITPTRESWCQQDVVQSKPKRDDGVTGCDRNVLLAFAGVADGAAPNRATGLKAPQQFSGGCVDGEEVALHCAAEHQTPGGRHDSRPRWRMMPEFPSAFAGHRVQSAQGSPGLFERNRPAARAQKILAWFIFRVSAIVNGAFFASVHVI